MFIISLDYYIDNDMQKLKKIIILNTIALFVMIIRISINEPLLYSLKRVDYFGYSVGFYKNNLGFSLAFDFLLLFYLFIKEKKIKYISIMVFLLYIILLSNSRKALIFPVLFIIFYLFFSMVKRNNLNIKKATLLLSIFAGALILIILIPELKERFISALQTFSKDDNVGDLSAIERRFYRYTAIDLFLKNPILGTGIYGFASYLVEINYSHIAYSHSNWLELLSTLGVIGYFLYYKFYLKLFTISYKNHQTKYGLYVAIFILLLFAFEYVFVSYYILYVQVIVLLLFKIINIENSNYGKNFIKEENL